MRVQTTFLFHRIARVDMESKFEYSSSLFSRFWIDDGVYTKEEILTEWFHRVASTREKIYNLTAQLVRNNESTAPLRDIYNTVGIYHHNPLQNRLIDYMPQEFTSRISKGDLGNIVGKIQKVENWLAFSTFNQSDFPFKFGWHIIMLSAEGVKALNEIATGKRTNQ